MTNDVEDFGFTLVSEEDITPSKSNELQQMFDLIYPLLDNLSKNPQRDIIKWPGAKRVETATDMIEKLKQILN